jgi:transcriptional regulator with XRE-family HTH domain
VLSYNQKEGEYMTQGERVRELRKFLNLTLEKFGKSLGVGKTAISKIENNERKLTEQMILSICREFRVNYFWLTEGKGDMFTGTPESVIDEIAEDYNLDAIDKKMLEKYLSLSKEERDVIKNFFKDIFT